jgi:hypothetical protein
MATSDTPTLGFADVPADALAWAGQHVAVNAAEAVRSNDWAKTYMLTGAGPSAYLKMVPAQRARQLAHCADIAGRFPAHVPEVLAFDAQRGWLLTADHGGQELGDDDDQAEAEQRMLLASLAGMQVQASRDPAWLAGFDHVDPTQMPRRLLQFLAADGGVVAPLGAAAFIGAPAAARYLSLLQPRMGLIAAHIAKAAELPPTLVHGDLHTGNAAQVGSDRCIIHDWDECAVGPAGTCLHALFDGATLPAILLARWEASGTPMDTLEGRLLSGYVRALAEGGYASEPLLRRCLAAAICAGQVRFIVTYGEFDHDPTARHPGRMIRQLLDNLLDLADWLAAQDPETALGMAADYEARREWVRARQLLQDQVARNPEDPVLIGHYARLARRAGDGEAAEEACREAIRLQPAEAAWRLELARVYLDRLDLTACRDALQAARERAPGTAELARLETRYGEFDAAVQAAAAPDGWPQVQVSPEERAQGVLQPDTLTLLIELFRAHGVVQINGVFEPDYIGQLHRTFLERYAREMGEREHDNHLQVGDRRYMLTLAMDDVFGAPQIIANGLLLPAMHRLFGKDCILGAYTTVISLPGSEDQQIHKDHTPLFDEEGWSLELPCVAAQVIVPLIRMDHQTGPTRSFKDTQGIAYQDAVGLPSHDPVIEPGSCLFIDYATVHYGLANRSQQVRPIMSMVYSRPWFRDVWNYHLQPPMRFTSAFFERAPNDVRKLIAWREIERRTVHQEDDTPSSAGFVQTRSVPQDTK